VAQGKVDWNSFAGRITDAILQEAKNLEQGAISRRILSGQLLKAEKGIDTGGRPLYGYARVPDPERGAKLVPDGRKAEVVQLIFRMYDQGHTLFAIRDELYRRGVPSPRGKAQWTRSVIQRVLTNRRYVGDWTWGVQPQGKRHRCDRGAHGGLRETTRGEPVSARRSGDPWQVIPDSHEPLVDRETFQRVQARLANNRENLPRHRNGGTFALSKLLVCGHCGSFLVGVTEYGKRRYVCRGYLAHGKSYCRKNWVPEKGITRAIVRKLQAAFLDPGHLQELRERVAEIEAAQRSESNLGALRRQVTDLEAQIRQGNERLLILPEDRLPGATAALRAWEADLAKARAELQRVETASPVRDLEARIEAAERALWSLHDALQAEDVPLLRELFRELIERVELHWTHAEAGRTTVARFERGVVCPRTSPEPSLLSPSASRSRC
jgi:hypothetical protein